MAKKSKAGNRKTAKTRTTKPRTGGGKTAVSAAKKPAAKSGRKSADKSGSNNKATTTKKAAAASNNKPTAKRSSSPTQLLGQIKKLDRDLAKIMNQRAALATKYAVSNGDGNETTVAADLAQIADSLDLGKGPLPKQTVSSVFRELVSGCHSLAKATRVSYLGPEYSYCHLAALERFGSSAELVPVGAISAVFEEVHRGHAKYGIVPLENSTDGRIADTLDMFTRLPVRIAGEVQMRIHHCLLGKCSRGEVMEVYSRPQALSQCRNWLVRHLPGARTVELTSTSAAAQMAAHKQGAAAIASRQAGLHHGLEILAERIEDNGSNITRFAVISDESSPRTGRDKTAIMFQTEHAVGALADALAIFKRNRLNLTWIESFPVPEEPGAYLFFVELEGHESDVKVRRTVASLERKTVTLEVLGSYAKTEVVE